MSPSHHQCIDTKHAQIFWWPFSPPHGGKDKHQDLIITKKHAKLQYWKDHMLIEIKDAKPIKHQLEKHMKYDGMNKDEVNPNGKHQ
jgi:hypothetical protein